MARISKALQAEPSAWDQAMFNYQLFFLSHGDYVNPACTVRVMDIEQFMNSKVSFAMTSAMEPGHLPSSAVGRVCSLLLLLQKDIGHHQGAAAYSQVLFKKFRHKPLSQITGDNRPVMVHMYDSAYQLLCERSGCNDSPTSLMLTQASILRRNYHPDKFMRMRGAIQFFLQGVTDALRTFPGGSEPGS